MASYPNITGQRVACKTLVKCSLGAAKPRSTAVPSTTPSVNAVVVTEVRPISEFQTPGSGATDVSSRHDAPREDSRELGTKYEPYVWTKHWYPLASVAELDETRPHAYTVLGKDLVVWRDGSNTWRAFQDMCPHRLAPLSEGRVEADGSLLCAYHAWRFDGSGACTAIPQARDEQQESVAKRAARACVKAYPTCEAQGVVWVWPDDSPSAPQDSAAEGPRVIEEVQDERLAGRVTVKAWRSMEVPYGHDFFLENALDPSRNRYTDPVPIVLQPASPLSREEGFKYTNLSHKSIGNQVVEGGVTISSHFLPPCLVRITAEDKKGGKTILALYSTPSRPGRSQILVTQVGGPAFIHQDSVFLHRQEKIAAQPELANKRAVDKYFMPTSADRMVLALHQWLERFSPAGIPYYGAFEGAALPEVERDPHKLFDTWNTHTRRCKICKSAHDNMVKGQPLAWIVAAVAAVQATILTASSAATNAAALAAAGMPASAATTASAFSVPPPGALACLAVALLAVGVALLMAKLVGLFHVFPFSHADNH
ncbi:Rieske [Haematococcus lacustris]